MPRNILLGEQIDHLIRALALAKKWTMTKTIADIAGQTGYSESAVYRWRQGRLQPPDEVLVQLVQMGREVAELDRGWGERLLRAASHPEADSLLSRFWGLAEVRIIPHNLPVPSHSTFVGRQRETTRLVELLSPERAAHLITVDGIGGVGKTTLVLEVAYRCLRASTGERPDSRIPSFEAILFTSAKQQYLTPYGILARQQNQRTLRDIFREIARTLDRPEITQATPEEQPRRVWQALARQRTLLIVDNMETIEDKQEVLTFLYDLPPQVKVIMTTRERALFSPIRLEQLPELDGLRLLHYEAEEKGITLSDEQARAIYQRTSGVPAAMIYTIGQLAVGYTVETLLARLLQHEGDIARFCFEQSVAPLRGQPAHCILMALSLFPKEPMRDAVLHVADLAHDPLAADDGLVQLQRLSLVTQAEGRYRILPLTREYALAELAAHSEFEVEAKERWVKWYQILVERYGGEDGQEWHVRYDLLEEEWINLLVVFNWCATQGRYEIMREFWLRGVSAFSIIYGYWGDHHIWLDWIIQTAERLNDQSTALEGMDLLGWLLTQKGQERNLEKAENLLTRACTLRSLASPLVQCGILDSLAQLRTRQKRYDEALHTLNEAEELLSSARLEDCVRIRQHIELLYSRAMIYYQTNEMDQAEQLFRKMIKHTQSVGWQRAETYAQNWLADLAIAKDELNVAEELLQVGLSVVERNKEKRRTSFFQRSFAHLEQKRCNFGKARHWAEAALDGFDHLGMQPEIDEMRAMLALLPIEE